MKPISLLIAFLLAGSAAWAQEYPANDGGQGPETPPGPGRGIARISVINGDVSVRRGDSGDVTAAALNAPLEAGDSLLTSSAARAELQFDASNMIRIAAGSEVRMGDLQFHRNQIQVALGLVTFTVLRNADAQNEIDTPLVAVHPKEKGAYRILVRDDATSEITVRAGEADVASAQGSQALRAGQTMVVRGSKDDPEFQISNAIQQDDWDRWNSERDHELMNATSTRYVNPDINGAEDLDQYGHWVNDSSYGMVWAPTVTPDWAPYRAGRWVWADDYGWTWVSYDPWGWAPYHYGRWYRASFGWAWWPGPLHSPCYWSPALVGFFGFGGGGGVGFAFGNVGWVPLAPYERLHPWWGRGFGGYRNTVVVNNVNVYNTYRNARVGDGITGVGAGDFGRHTGRFTAVSGAQIRSAGMVRGALPVAPQRASLRLSDRAVSMSNFRQSRNTQFFTRSGTPQVRSVPFEQQRQAVQRGFRSSNSGGQRTGVGGTAPAVQGSVRQNGWSRFNGSGGAARVEAAPRPSGRYSSPYTGEGNSVRVNPSIVRDRPVPQPSTPAARSYGGSGAGNFGGGRSSSYIAPRTAPSYSAPRSAPSYSAPRSAPSYSAPRSAPRSGGGYHGGGGGGGRSSGGGGGRSSGGGGGRHR